jgi:hypothetical protein
MFRFSALLSLAVLGLLAGGAGAQRVPNSANRVPSQKVPSSPTIGGRFNVFVPYTTNGISTLGVAQGVAPAIYARPSVNDPVGKGVVPVYNLIFYGAKQSFNNSFPGAMPGRGNSLRPNRY